VTGWEVCLWNNLFLCWVGRKTLVQLIMIYVSSHIVHIAWSLHSQNYNLMCIFHLLYLTLISSLLHCILFFFFYLLPLSISPLYQNIWHSSITVVIRLKLLNLHCASYSLWSWNMVLHATAQGTWICSISGDRIIVLWRAYISGEEVCWYTEQHPLTSIICTRCHKVFGHIVWASQSLDHNWPLEACLHVLPTDWV